MSPRCEGVGAAASTPSPVAATITFTDHDVSGELTKEVPLHRVPVRPLVVPGLAPLRRESCDTFRSECDGGSGGTAGGRGRGRRQPTERTILEVPRGRGRVGRRMHGQVRGERVAGAPTHPDERRPPPGKRAGGGDPSPIDRPRGGPRGPRQPPHTPPHRRPPTPEPHP